MTDPTPDEALAAWVAGLQAADLVGGVRDDALDLALDLVQDAIASALLGARAQERPTVIGLARDLAGTGDAPVIAGTPLAPLGAAFANGFQVTAATACDVHRPTMTHVTPEVVPAAIAAIAIARDAGHVIDGATFLAAITAGAEVTVRVAMALDDPAFRARRWHNPGIAGAIGASAAASRVLGLDAPRVAFAFGHAAGQAAGTFAALGTAGVKVHQARGAVSGLLAAVLAARGLDASRRAFSDPGGGLLTAYADGGDPSALTDDLGATWRLRGLSLRRWPGSSSVQPVIEAALAIVTALADDPSATPIKVEVALPSGSYALGGEAGWHDQLSALQSPRWVTAAILQDHAWGLAQVSPSRINDAHLGSFAAEVLVRPDVELPPTGVALSVRLADGRQLDERRDDALGAPARPLSRDDRRAKFADAIDGLGWSDRADALVAALDGLPDAPDLDPLLALLSDPERDPTS